MEQELQYYIGFSVFPGIGPVRFRLLRDYFGSAKSAWNAPVEALLELGLGTKLAESFDCFRKNFNFDTYQQRLHEEQIFLLMDIDPRYPILLRQLIDHPFLLYIKGKKTADHWDLSRAIAIVGTRQITDYGRIVTRSLATELVGYGYTIVSGLAGGVDSMAHRAALDAGGKTIAVLGCGVDVIAPPANTALYWDIINGGGAIVSEMPLGLRPSKRVFPARNRIISGLSRGVVVTEGAEDSGSLITARYAAEQGREVFAVPGPITSLYSQGPFKLLKNGAKIVTSVRDILEELEPDLSKLPAPSDSKPFTQLTAVEQSVVKHLSDRQLHVDELVRLTQMTASQLTATITLLEIRGIIRDYGEKVYGMA